MNNKQLIISLEALPRFEGSHCPDQSHEYIKRVNTGRYVRLEDVIKILNKDRYGYYK